MQHLRWEKTGRIFSHADEGKPNQFTYRSSIGQHNVDLGNGQFAPYVWDKTKRVVRFADCELRFTASGLEFWNGKERLNTLSFNPEIKTIDFVKKVPVVSGLTVEEIDPGNSKVELKISYKLTTEDSETEVSVRAGYNSKVHFGTKFKALKDGAEQGIELAFAEKFEPVEEKDREGKILPTARLKTAKSWWAWDRSEQVDHEIEQTTVTKVHLGRKVYALNEEKIISPDTWGPTGITDSEDDGYNEHATSWVSSANNVYSGYWGSAGIWAGWSWHLPDLASDVTINGMYLRAYCTEAWGGGDPIIKLVVEDSDYAFAALWGNSHFPSAATWIRANSTFEIAHSASTWYYGAADTNPINIGADLQDLITEYGAIASGDRINIALGPNSYVEDNDVGYEAYDNAGTNEAELTITYTPAAGGASIPGNPFRKPFVRPFGGVL